MAGAAVRTLVTGGAGFLGSHLCERLLAEGRRVVCVDDFSTGRRENVAHLVGRRDFRLLAGDVCDPLSLAVDEIFHLACPASPPRYQRDPARTLRTCALGTLNVFELARRSGARVLIASTSEVYGDPLVHPQREEYWGNVNPIGPRSSYDEGKRCAEAAAIAYAHSYGVASRIARIFNTYGPRMLIDDGRVVSNFVAQCVGEEPLTIFGDGSQTRSFCYVDDLIEGLVRLMASPEPEPINLGNPHECSILELALLVRRLVGGSSEIRLMPRPPDDPTRRRPDIGRAVERLGWRPSVPLEEGLRRTIEDFRARLIAPAAARAASSERA